MTDLAHVLPLPVTAEGIETQHERDEVRAIGCEFAQGFFFAHPMPAAAIAALLSKPGTGTGQLPKGERTASAAAAGSSAATR